MKFLASRGWFLFFALLILGAMPSAALADEFEFDTPGFGNGPYSIDDIVVNGSTLHFTFFDGMLAARIFSAVQTESEIPAVTLDDFATVNGVPTLVATDTFTDAVTTALVAGMRLPNGLQPMTAVFTFESEQRSVVGGDNGGGNGNAVPEPSSLRLLGLGLIGLVAAFRRKSKLMRSM